MNDIAVLWYLCGFVVGALIVNVKPMRRAVFIVLFGLPTMLLGYVFGYIQAGFMTGYKLYLRDRE